MIFKFGDPKQPASYVMVLILCSITGVCFSAIKVSVPGILRVVWGSPAHVSPVMGLCGPAISVAVLVGSVGLQHTGQGDYSTTAKNPFLYACAFMSVLSCFFAQFALRPPPS